MVMEVPPDQYPEAAGEAAHYEGLETSLATIRDAINDALDGVNNQNPARTVNTALLNKATTVDGAYYNRYAAKRDVWVSIHGGIIADFDTFIIDIDSCITSARDLKDLWNSRIGLKG